MRKRRQVQRRDPELIPMQDLGGGSNSIDSMSSMEAELDRAQAII
ncbi:unnamed protein product, partial [Allacma fusca]